MVTIAELTRRVVLERGIVVDRVNQNEWQFRSKGGYQTSTLGELTSALGVHVVQIGVDVVPELYQEFLAPVSPANPVLEMQVQRLTHDRIAEVEGRFAAELPRIGYVAEAATYHCPQLVRQYVGVIDSVTRGGKDLDLGSDDFLYSGAVTPYFEFDALVTVVIRAYDTVRFVLWSAFGAGHDAPTNFRRVVETLTPSAAALVPTLKSAVLSYNEAKEYRDCIQHYAHFGARLPFARVQLLGGRAWSVLALLPDNPQARSYRRFEYARKLDALSYGWRLTDALLGTLRDVVAALPVR